MRSELEIQRAHDLLNQLDQIRPQFPLLLRAARDVLCWVLSHKNEFDETLKEVEAHLREMGFELEDTGKLNYPNGEGPVH